jgi:hypothetical protein
MSSQQQPRVGFDWLAIDCIAAKRKRLHEQVGNHRPAYAVDSLTAERIGAASEAAFALHYDLRRPDADKVNGDSGFDYQVWWGDEKLTIEIKASEYTSPSLMLSEQYDHAVDRYVLASVSWPDEVTLIGWIDSGDVANVASREKSQFGGYMEVVDNTDLNPMPACQTIQKIAEVEYE